MFGSYFYNESMRRMTIGFGQIFNNILIKRRDSAGNITQSIKVPLAYAPKEKFLARLDAQPSLDNREFAVTLPRMSFEISGISYDSSRKITRVQKFKHVKAGKEGKVLNYNYVPVPYNISYNLYSFTASAEAGLQIIEQILPFFQPDFTVTINAIPDLNIKRDIPIILNTVNYEDTYNGEFTQRRAVIYTLQFTAKTYLYGPMSNQGIIKSAQADLGADTEPALARDERITIVTKPTTADADDDFGFTTTITSFDDGKRYNPVSDTDE